MIQAALDGEASAARQFNPTVIIQAALRTDAGLATDSGSSEHCPFSIINSPLIYALPILRTSRR